MGKKKKLLAMRKIISSHSVNIPAEVNVSVAKQREIIVSGPRGKLTRNFSDFDMDIYISTIKGNKDLKVDAYHAKREHQASLRTLCSHVANMITGVTKGFKYKMRLVYAHFPINLSIDEKGEKIEIRNFLGEKRVRYIEMLGDVACARSNTLKDELILTGNNLEFVSRSAALISQACLVKNKDIRKFLDGIYVSEKSTITDEKI